MNAISSTAAPTPELREAPPLFMVIGDAGTRIASQILPDDSRFEQVLATRELPDLERLSIACRGYVEAGLVSSHKGLLQRSRFAPVIDVAPAGAI